MKNVKRVVIITADWDYLRKDLDSLCEQVLRIGFECEIHNYNEEAVISLLIKYGISNGIIRIPQIYVIQNGEIRRVGYRVLDSIKLDIDEVINEVIRK
nr:MAG: hypothetical protein TU36_01710 [Vulcanisaeta sp. AZ3]